MKVAFHFECIDNHIQYLLDAESKIFHILLRLQNHTTSSKWFSGDLLFSSLSYDSIETENGHIEKFNSDKFVKIINHWLNPPTPILNKILEDKLSKAFPNGLFAICAENLDYFVVLKIHNELLNLENYLGFIEIDDTSIIHWELYTNLLFKSYRIIGKDLFILWDENNQESPDESLLDFWKKTEFRNIEFESLNVKYSIFDSKHNFKNSKNNAEVSKNASYMFNYIVNNVITKGCAWNMMY